MAAAVTQTTKTMLYFGVPTAHGQRQAGFHRSPVPVEQAIRQAGIGVAGAGKAAGGCGALRAAEPGRSLFTTGCRLLAPQPGRGSARTG